MILELDIRINELVKWVIFDNLSMKIELKLNGLMKDKISVNWSCGSDVVTL